MLNVRLKVLILLTITVYVHVQEHSQKASPLTNIILLHYMCINQDLDLINDHEPLGKKTGPF